MWLMDLGVFETGCQLSEHQEPAGLDLPDCGGHDQRQDTGGDKKDV